MYVLFCIDSTSVSNSCSSSAQHSEPLCSGKLWKLDSTVKFCSFVTSANITCCFYLCYELFLHSLIHVSKYWYNCMQAIILQLLSSAKSSSSTLLTKFWKDGNSSPSSLHFLHPSVTCVSSCASATISHFSPFPSPTR